jgi:hypothetical protein
LFQAPCRSQAINTCKSFKLLSAQPPHTAVRGKSHSVLLSLQYY